MICTARSNGGACDGLLYTLKPGQDATATLRSLLDLRVKARGPLNETSTRLYVGLDELLSTAQANAAGAMAPATTADPVTPLAALAQSRSTAGCIDASPLPIGGCVALGGEHGLSNAAAAQP